MEVSIYIIYVIKIGLNSRFSFDICFLFVFVSCYVDRDQVARFLVEKYNANRKAKNIHDQVPFDVVNDKNDPRWIGIFKGPFAVSFVLSFLPYFFALHPLFDILNYIHMYLYVCELEF